MAVGIATTQVLVLGLGNVLLTDDGVGIHVIRALERTLNGRSRPPAVTLCDGGTLGLNLLFELDSADALIAVDAMDLGAPPGTVRAFDHAALDARLSGKRGSVHELALADLLAAAELTGRRPSRRALVAIQPGSTDWGLDPTAAVAAAIPGACRLIQDLLEEWGDCPDVPRDAGCGARRAEA
ncbi:MAG: hydrogenase maturation protease [Gammaproteobacteria bacterium]|nr:hydrogenase maturation protease [Gammaproteobacteria bacterium]